MNLAKIKLRANLMLLLTALIWGTTFVAQKTASMSLDPFLFNGARCLIGAFSLFIISLFLKEKHKTKRRHLVEGGVMAGVLLFLGLGLQQAGIGSSSASHAGFISSLYIVMVPVFALISGRKIEKSVFLGIIFAIFGLYFLCVTDGLKIQKGDLTILFSAVFFALHIICISKYSKKTDPIKLSGIQFLTAGLVSFAVGLMYERAEFGVFAKCVPELFYTGVLSCAVAYTLQINAQKHIRPYIASLILSLESVFAVMAGALFLNESLSLREVLGCVLMFAAVFIAQRRKKPVRTASCKN